MDGGKMHFNGPKNPQGWLPAPSPQGQAEQIGRRSVEWIGVVLALKYIVEVYIPKRILKYPFF